MSTKKTVKAKSSYQMSIACPEKERLVVSCTKEEKQYIKLLAAKNNLTMSEYLLSHARLEMPKFNRGNIPNKETAKVLRNSDEGKNLIEVENLDDFWEELGFNKHA